MKKNFVQRYIRQNHVPVSSLSLEYGECVVSSERSPNKISINEDASLVMTLGKHSTILAVADGAGGHIGGEKAAETIINDLYKSLLSVVDPSNLRDAILNAIENSNKHLLAQGQGSATTLVVAEIQVNTIRSYHIGDSSLMVFGQRGIIKLQTTSHSPVGFGIEAGYIDEDQAQSHEEKHLVLNLLGTSEMRVEMGSPLNLARYDTILLCSDGLTDNLTTNEIVTIMQSGHLKKRLNELVCATKIKMEADNGQPDDLTVIGYRRNNRSNFY